MKQTIVDSLHADVAAWVERCGPVLEAYVRDSVPPAHWPSSTLEAPYVLLDCMSLLEKLHNGAACLACDGLRRRVRDLPGGPWKQSEPIEPANSSHERREPFFDWELDRR